MTTLAKEVDVVDGETTPESKPITDILEELNSIINARQLNVTFPWDQKTTTASDVESDPCSKEAVFDRDTGTCLGKSNNLIVL